MSDKEIRSIDQDVEGAEQLATTGLSKPAVESLETPGALLRHYRQERQVSLPELAAVLKVTPDKLQALESDRYEALPDMVFTRALAMSICRLLAVDATPVMEKFPSVNSPKLGRDSDGLNRAFKGGEQPAIGASNMSEGGSGSKVLLLVSGLLIAAAAVYFWPQIHNLIDPQDSSSALTQPNANGSSVVLSAVDGAPGVLSLQVPGLLALQDANPQAATAIEEPFAAQLPVSAIEVESGIVSSERAEMDGSELAIATVATEPSDAVAEVLDTIHILAQEPVWVQIRDGSNAIVHQSTLSKGRELSITNNPPLRVEIGRADAVQVRVKGQTFDIAPYARKNVARFEVNP